MVFPGQYVRTYVFACVRACVRTYVRTYEDMPSTIEDTLKLSKAVGNITSISETINRRRCEVEADDDTSLLQNRVQVKRKHKADGNIAAGKPVSASSWGWQGNPSTL